jgi:hypothetical protein
MTMKTSIHSVVLGASLLLCGVLNLRADPTLLANKGLNGQKLDADEVKAVLLGKKTTLGSDRVVIVIAKSGDSQEAFLKERVGMTTDQFQTYWRRLFMTGGGSAPKVADTEADAAKLAAETPGAIVVGDSAKADGLVVIFAK